MTDLDNAVVLITGAAGGFGRQMVRQFAAAGSRLVLHDLHQEALHATRDELAGASESVLACVASDLSDAAGCDSLFAALDSARIPIDILVNNAGIGVGGRLDLVPRDRWEQVVQVDLLSPMRLCELFLPQMIERQSGHIVNISSIAGWAGGKGLTSYSAAKFGLRGFGESLHADVEACGIKVSTVYPWFSKTAILDSEQYGPEAKMQVPDDIATEPADVVAEIVAGIKKNRQHIFPDRMARRIHLAKRYFPGLLDRMIRRMQRKLQAQDAAAGVPVRISLRARIIRFVSRLMFKHISADSNVKLIRESFEHTQGKRRAARGVRSEDTTINGVKCLWLIPDGCDDAPVLYYLHGGAYLMGSPRTHRKMVSHIAREARVRALLPDYALAPEHAFPAGLDDCIAVYRSLLGSGTAAGNIVIGGDSAGGGMSMATLLSLRRDGDDLPRAAVLLSPWADLTMSGESMTTRVLLEPWFRPDDMHDIARMYCPEGDLADPLLSPVYGDATGLPPMLIQVGDHEILLSDSTRIADNIEAAGGEVEIQIWQQMWHVFQIFVGQMPESKRAIQAIASYIRKQIATDQ